MKAVTSPRFFRLHDDVQFPGRWELGNPVDDAGQPVDPWQFTEGHALTVDRPLTLPVEAPGVPLDFSLAGFSIPVVPPKVAALFSELAPGDVQLLPVRVEGHAGPYVLLVVTHLIRCLDEKASEEVLFWTAEDGLPEKVGQYKSIAGARIDKARVGGTRAFRLWGWPGALIVSEDLKRALEHARASGVQFTEV